MARTLFYLGPEGTFAHSAALSVHQRLLEAGDDFKLSASTSIVSVFDDVSQDTQALGVVPIENSTEGSVSFTMDALVEHDELCIVGEETLRVEQCLLGCGSLDQVQSVLSHPHGLAQCKRWLHQHLPQAKLVTTNSTAAAAHAVQEQPEAAAIASELAGQLAGLSVLARGVQDRKRNATRFLVLGHAPVAGSGNDKTSIVFSTPHERGALYRALGVFDRHQINLSRIESRPMADAMWEYVFFADLEGHQGDPNVTAALAELAADEQMLRVLGSYPAANPVW